MDQEVARAHLPDEAGARTTTAAQTQEEEGEGVARVFRTILEGKGR
jgi:hypothetical protein